jgi:YVTN family beta-propeller protein
MRFLFLLLVPVLLALTSPNVHSAQIAYVTNDEGTVSVIDVASREETATITVGDDPWEVAFTPDGSKAYVANSGSDTVSVIDVATSTVIETIPVGANPQGVAVSPDGSIVYVTNVSPGTVTVIDVSTDSITEIITNAGTDPGSVAFHASGEYAYIADGGGALRVIDVEAGEVIHIESPFPDPFYLDTTQDGSTIFIVDANGNFQVFDTSTSPQEPVFDQVIMIPDFTQYFAFSPDSSIAYATTASFFTPITVVDVETRTIIENITFGDEGVGELGVAFCQDGQEALAVRGSPFNDLTVINVENSEVDDTIQAGDSPFWVAITDFPSFSGIRRTNRFAMQMEFFDQLIWPPSLNPAIVSYRILEGQIVLGEVSASDPLVFLARNRPKTLPVTYTLQALDENGNIIATFTTTIP